MDKSITYLTELNSNFSEAYFKARKLERRIISDEVVKSLPFVNRTNPNFKEWQLRQKSTKRILKYLNQNFNEGSILDLGCGNGWFLGQVQKLNKFKLYGLDIHLSELKQASRIFSNINTHFFYGDIRDENFNFPKRVNVVILNASVQYFNDFELLIRNVKKILKKDGEIHILDSPFYKSHELKESRIRTAHYYRTIAVPEMIEFYYHHSEDFIKEFEVLYEPRYNILNRLFKDSPFKWLKFHHVY